MDSSQSHVENPQTETRFIRQSRSKPSTTGALMEVPPTRSQQEAEAQTTARTESKSPLHLPGELLQRFHHSV